MTNDPVPAVVAYFRQVSPDVGIKKMTQNSAVFEVQKSLPGVIRAIKQAKDRSASINLAGKTLRSDHHRLPGRERERECAVLDFSRSHRRDAVNGDVRDLDRYRVELITAEAEASLLVRHRRLIRFPQLTMPLR